MAQLRQKEARLMQLRSEWVEREEKVQRAEKEQRAYNEQLQRLENESKQIVLANGVEPPAGCPE